MFFGLQHLNRLRSGPSHYLPTTPRVEHPYTPMNDRPSVREKPLLSKVARETGQWDWQDGHQKRRRPAMSCSRTLSPQRRQGRPAR